VTAPGPRSIGWRIATAVLAALLAGTPAMHAAGRAVLFRANDGRMVNALFMEATQQQAPAVVLVPMLGRSKDDWNVLGQRFADIGINALAIDLPSTASPADGFGRWHLDIAAAIGFLVSRPEIRPSSIGVLGASLGANLAAVEAAADPRVRALALVSPSLDYRGVRLEAPFRNYGSRPALLVASLGDPYAARTVRALVAEASTHEVQWSEVKAHGTLLLAADQMLAGRVVDWFRRVLGAG
jgi:dienelactone hydrolase